MLPDSGVLGIVKRLVDTEPSLTLEQKMEFERLAGQQERLEALKEMNAQDNVSERWIADASGDIKLAKYIRPIVLITLTVFFMGLTILDATVTDFTPKQSYIDLLQVLMLTVFGAYFAGRTIEKVRK